MNIQPKFIGHDTPFGLINIISDTEFTWQEGKDFLTVSRIQEHLDIMNPKLSKHWFVPRPTGRILPIRSKKDPNPVKTESLGWLCGYRIECDWNDPNIPILKQFGGIDIWQ